MERAYPELPRMRRLGRELLRLLNGEAPTCPAPPPLRPEKALASRVRHGERNPLGDSPDLAWRFGLGLTAAWVPVHAGDAPIRNAIGNLMQDNDWATIKLRWTGLWQRYVLGRGERVSPEEQSLIFLGHLEVYRFAAQFVRDREVLDVGCGTGYGCDHLRQAGARSVTGIDIARTAVRYARRHYPDPRLTFERMNAEVLRYSDARFDLVMSFENLEHLPKPERCLAEIRRVLRPGGLLVLATPNKELSSPGLTRCLNPYHLREYYFDELDALLRRYFAEVVIFETTFDGSQEAQRLKADRRERGRIGLESGDQNSLMVGPWTVSRNHQKNSHSFLALAWG